MSSDSSRRRNPTHCNPRTDKQIDHCDTNIAPADCNRSFVRDKFVWLDQARADPELTALAFMLAYMLANLVNEGEGFAWPSVARLAVECRVTERGVQKVIARLVERGHLSVEFGSGRGETNRYRWILNNDDGAQGIEERQNERRRSPCDGKAQPAPRHSDRKARTSVHPIETERVNQGSEKGEQLFQKGRTPVHPTLFKESIYDPIYRFSSQRNAQSPPIGFDNFWRVYPKKSPDQKRLAPTSGPSNGRRQMKSFAARSATPPNVTVKTRATQKIRRHG